MQEGRAGGQVAGRFRHADEQVKGVVAVAADVALRRAAERQQVLHRIVAASRERGEREVKITGGERRVKLLGAHAHQLDRHARGGPPHIEQTQRRRARLLPLHKEEAERRQARALIVSGRGHQPRRLGAALGIALGVRRAERAARRAEVLPALGRVADAVGHTAGRRRRRHAELFGERRAVDGKVKGTAQLRVGEGVGQMVVEHTDRLRQRSGLPRLILRQLLDGRVGQLRGVVQLAGKKLIVVRLRVRLEAEANAVRHDELALVVFAVSLRLKLRGLYPCAHGIGAVRHDVGGRRPTRIPLHQITAQRGRRRRRADAGDEVSTGPAERHEKGALALGLHAEQRHVAALAHLVIARDHAQKRGVGRRRRGIDQPLPGVNEVLRRHALAVRPAGRGAQRERIGHGVVVILFLDVFLGDARHGDRLAGAVVAHPHQALKERGEQALRPHVGVHGRVKRLQRTADRGAHHKVLRGLLLLAAAGEQGQKQRRTEQQTDGSSQHFHRERLLFLYRKTRREARRTGKHLNDYIKICPACKDERSKKLQIVIIWRPRPAYHPRSGRA